MFSLYFRNPEGLGGVPFLHCDELPAPPAARWLVDHAVPSQHSATDALILLQQGTGEELVAVRDRDGHEFAFDSDQGHWSPL